MLGQHFGGDLGHAGLGVISNGFWTVCKMISASYPILISAKKAMDDTLADPFFLQQLSVMISFRIAKWLFCIAVWHKKSNVINWKPIKKLMTLDEMTASFIFLGQLHGWFLPCNPVSHRSCRDIPPPRTYPAGCAPYSQGSPRHGSPSRFPSSRRSRDAGWDSPRKACASARRVPRYSAPLPKVLTSFPPANQFLHATPARSGHPWHHDFAFPIGSPASLDIKFFARQFLVMLQDILECLFCFRIKKRPGYTVHFGSAATMCRHWQVPYPMLFHTLQ